jgi:FkbM family methyltransferase
MAIINQLQNRWIKAAIKLLGLQKQIQKLKPFLLLNKKYRTIKRFKVDMNNVIVQFSTEDTYSNRWFFPRYVDGKVHEKQVTEMLLSSLKKACCFVDVGTNLGWYTCLASKNMPEGIIYGFEMDNLNYALLQKNLAINQCDNTEVYHAAISDVAGMIRYKRQFNFPSVSFRLSLDDEEIRPDELVSVESLTLDDFFENRQVRPDVIKIDVEGAEINVLRGMKKIIQEHKPILFIEVHPSKLPIFHSSSEELLAILIERGYEVFEIDGIRDQESNKKLRKLYETSKLAQNTMIYATFAK